MEKASTYVIDPPPAYEQDAGIDNTAFDSGDEKLDVNTTNDTPEKKDPWALPELKVNFTPWAELTSGQKMKRLFVHYILKITLLIGCLYLFICSLGFLGDAFKLLGGKTAGQVLQDSEIIANPVAGLMIGVLATVLLQSSSTTTTIIVSMVAEEVLTVKLAIPLVMGANIGTSVTNTIVSMGQITDRDDFRRAFAGATVHDMFNWLSVLILLPLEILTGYLEWFSGVIIDSMLLKTNKGVNQDFLKVITNPFTKVVIQIDKGIIEKIARGDNEYLDKSILKICCDKKKTYVNETVSKLVNGTLVNSTEEVQQCIKPCDYMFVGLANSWSDAAIGALILVAALFIMCVCLVCIVKLLHSLLKGQIAVTLRKFVNANFPGKVCGYFTGYLAILLGAGFTILVQSSSIFTSSITPLVGMGVISLERMYPLTLGSNIGTTATGLLAALAQDADKIPHALQIAFCHLFFNISGIIIFYPFPFFRPAIGAAKFLGTKTEKYRWFAVVYLLVMFFILPAVTFALSEVSWIALASVFIPILVIILIVGIIKCLQAKKPGVLPHKFQNWKWLPKGMRSLEPYDRGLMKVTGNCWCCRKCRCCKDIFVEAVPADEIVIKKTTNGIGPVITQF